VLKIKFDLGVGWGFTLLLIVVCQLPMNKTGLISRRNRHMKI